MREARLDLLFNACPLLSEIAAAVIDDLERLVRVQCVLRPLIDEDAVQSAFVGTYSGNTLPVFKATLVHEAILITSRLFAKPRLQKNKDIDTVGSDRSLYLAMFLFKYCKEVRGAFDRDSFRWGASGTYSIIEDGVIRDETLPETLRVRIQGGRQNRQACGSRLEASIAEIEEFYESKAYAFSRVFRSERLAHNLDQSNDRRIHRFDGDLGATTFDAVDKIISQAIVVGERAVSAMFRRSLSLDESAKHWTAYARQFWSKASGVPLPTFLDEPPAGFE